MNIKASLKVLIIVLGVLSSLYLIQHYFTSQMRKTPLLLTLPYWDSITLPIANEENVRYESEPKIMNILYWLKKEYYQDPNYLKRMGCKVTNCLFTSDASAVDAMEWDALLLNPHVEGLYEALGHKRSPKTYWIFDFREPPYLTNLIKRYKGIEFNLSMSWRRDSDFLLPYFIFSKRSQPRESSNLVNYAAGKTEKIAWMVRNKRPKSRRNILVSTLKKYIQVDIYGLGGDGKRCNFKCTEEMYKKYKFYLSFENELCVDYITEKLFRAYTNNMIPVVYGLGYENYNLPPHSYIDVLDFPNVKKLADYLDYLDKNDTAYNEYFEWKYNYRVNFETTSRVCEICEFLHKANDFNSDPNAKGNMKEKNRPFIPPKEGALKIKMPKEEDVLQYIQINGSNFRIVDFKKWHAAVCVTPSSDRNLYDFITGNL